MSGNEKHTIVFLSHWARRQGGAEYSLYDILCCARHRFDCHLITSEQGALFDSVQKLGVHCHCIPCHPSVASLRRQCSSLMGAIFLLVPIGHYLVYVKKIHSLIASLKPSLIHANIPKSHIALLLLSRMGYHGVSCYHIREIFSKKSIPFLLYMLLWKRHNSCVIAISRAVQQNIPKQMSCNTHVIYNGITVPSRYKMSFSSVPLKLVYLGRVVPWKGIHLLINIFSRLREQFPSRKIQLTIIGDTLYWPHRYRMKLAAMIETLHLSSVCSLLPSTAAPAQILIEHDIFCNVSFEEPFGRSVAEAQACGLPVVAYESGGISEIVTHYETGILVPYGNESAFIEAIAVLWDSPDLFALMSRKARKRMLHCFNKEKQVPHVCQFLDDQISLQYNNPCNDTDNNSDYRQNNKKLMLR